MPALLWRIVIAVIAVVLLFALLPPVLRIFALDLSGDVLTVLKICIGGIALFYVIKGPPFPA